MSYKHVDGTYGRFILFQPSLPTEYRLTLTDPKQNITLLS